ncbi:MAG: sulfatase [Acidobacteria bacterium]|nr:sulfatase [Acidobacteriota bacterium]
MNRRNFLGGAAAAAVSCGRARRPNVVVMLTDDQRWDCMSCAGHPFLKTPHMDRLAAEGVRFTNAFVTTSLCSPSRASLLSGLYAHSHGVTNNFTEYPESLESYPRILQSEGYQTAYFGKWHMGENNDSPRPGFHHWVSHRGQGLYNDTEFNINGKREKVRGYYTTVVTDMAVDWLAKQSSPFCMILGHKAPHSANIPEPKYEHLFDGVDIKPPETVSDTGEGKGEWVRQRLATWHGIKGPLYGNKEYGKFVRTYLATIPSIDDSVGRIYEALQKRGDLDNTLFVFLADNGCLLGEHGAVDKRVMWEESIRVPLLVRYPERLRTAAVRAEMVLNIDFASAVLDFCGARPLAKSHGRSWKAVAEGTERGWRKSWYYEYNFENEFPYTPNVRGVRTDGWKYIHYPNGEGQPDTQMAELYDLANDPKETRNRISDPEAQPKVEELKAELARLIRAADGEPDRMPVNPVIRSEMPEEKIR